MSEVLVNAMTRKPRKISEIFSNRAPLAAVPAAHAAWPRQLFLPTVDIGLTAVAGPYPQYDLPAAAGSLGLKFFNLGHVWADPAGAPVVAGYRLNSPWDRGLRAQIAALRHVAGDVSVSFGGANAAETDAACVIDDADKLADFYETIVDAYGLQRVDFEIPGLTGDDTEVNERRGLAIARLQRRCQGRGRALDVWLSLPGRPVGFAAQEVEIIDTMLAAGVVLGGVNVLTMNFGGACAPRAAGRMGQYSIQAAHSTFSDLRALFDNHDLLRSDPQIWARIGVTPMVGQNDVQNERFELHDARELLDFAHEIGLGMVGLWSLNRDANTGVGNYDSTGRDEAPYAFTQLLAAYTGSTMRIRRPR